MRIASSAPVPAGISRRAGARLALALAVAALAGGHAAAADQAAAGGAAAKPNLVIVLTDDLGYGDIGCFGSQVDPTPNLDRMAQEGTRLTSFYSAQICTVSRVQLLTGCYGKRLSFPNNIGPVSSAGIGEREQTIAALLRQQGYATMIIGKWHVGDQPQFLPLHRGFDHYLGLPYSNDMGGGWDGVADVPEAKRKPPLPLMRDDQVIDIMEGDRQDGLTKLYTDEAIAFIRSSHEQHRPFFLYLAHAAGHRPIHPNPEFRGKSRNGLYGDWVAELDASTGSVLDELRELKLDGDTLVVFTSDNGPYWVKGKDEGHGSAGPLRGFKGSTYEGGMREPAIAWWPGHVPAGRASDAVSGLIDLLPTCVGLAGGTVPTERKIDGVDIAPLLLGRSDQGREVQYYFDREQMQAVRKGEWKLVVAQQRESAGDHSPQKPIAGFTPELFDLAADIGERHDVAEQHADVVQELMRFVREMDADLGCDRNGPGVRPRAYAKDPRPLLKTD